MGNLDDLPQPAAQPARAAGVGQIFLAPDHQRRGDLIDLGGRRAHARRKRGGRQAVLFWTRAGAAVENRVRDERATGPVGADASVRSRQQHGVPDARCALGGHGVRNDLLEAAEDDIRQHLPERVPRGDRGGMRRIQDRAQRGRDPNYLQRPRVVRHVVADHAANAEGCIGFGVVQRHVDTKRRQARRAIEIDLYVAVVDGQRAGNVHRLVVAIDIHLVTVDTVRQCGDLVLHRPLRARDDLRAHALERVELEIRHHLFELLAAGRIARRQGIKIALRHHRITNIRPHDIHQRLVERARAEQVSDGNVDSLFKDLIRVGSKSAAANVGNVARAGKERNRPVAAKDRRDDGKVVEMARRVPWIVGQQHIPGDQRRQRIPRQEFAHRRRHRVDVPGRSGHGLREHRGVHVEDAR